MISEVIGFGGLLAVLGIWIFFGLGIGILLLVSRWKINTLAGQPGWAILIPIYNLYIQTKVLQRPKYWFWMYIGFSITVIGLMGVIVMAIMDLIRLAKVFGKGDGFIVGMIFLPYIFIPILAFGDSQYQHLEN